MCLRNTASLSECSLFSSRLDSLSDLRVLFLPISTPYPMFYDKSLMFFAFIWIKTRFRIDLSLPGEKAAFGEIFVLFLNLLYWSLDAYYVEMSRPHINGGRIYTQS
jgi:hypothetical protein